MTKTFDELKNGDYIYVKKTYVDSNYEIVPFKIKDINPRFSIIEDEIIIIANEINLNRIINYTFEFSILNKYCHLSICGTSFSTNYEDLKEACAFEELKERAYKNSLLETSAQAINLRFRN